MADLGGRPAFSVGGHDCTWADVWDHGRSSGRWADLEREVAEGVACRDRGQVAPRQAVRAAGESFRRERRLHAAEEAEAWLSTRGITVAEWTDHLARTVLRQASPPPALVPDVAGRREVIVTGWCSGAFDAMARSLAVAVSGVEVDADRVRPDEVGALVARRRLEWVQVEADIAVLRHDDAGREAVQCLVVDGMSLDTLAQVSGATITRFAGFLEDLPPEPQQVLLPAIAGEVVGPVPLDGGSAVFVVRGKRAPMVDDEAVVARATEVIRASAVERVLEQVVWHEPG